MKIGIAAATSFEIEPTINFLSGSSTPPDHSFEVLITGIGCVAATYQLSKFISATSPALLIQAGIAGGFHAATPFAETFIVEDEIFGDIGVTENNSFNDLFDMGFMDKDSDPFMNKRMVNSYRQNWEKYGLPLAHGLTVNQITTDPVRIRQLRDKYNFDVESMEGAALHYVCLHEKIPFLQLRSVSNAIGERDKTKWKLKDSIINLNAALIKIIQQIS